MSAANFITSSQCSKGIEQRKTTKRRSKRGRGSKSWFSSNITNGILREDWSVGQVHNTPGEPFAVFADGMLERARNCPNTSILGLKGTRIGIIQQKYLDITQDP